MGKIEIPRRNGLFIRDRHMLMMLAWVDQRLPEEACGLLAGKGRRIIQIIPVENSLHSPVRFSMDPAGQLKAFQGMDDAGLELLGIFHSHPGGPSEPSPTDIAEFFYPGTVSVILSRHTGVWQVRGFWIEDGQVNEFPLFNHLFQRAKR